MAEPRLIRPLTDADRACLSCDVPDGCDDTHPFCTWRELGGDGKSPLSLKSRQILERQRSVWRCLGSEGAEVAELACTLDWDAAVVYLVLRALRRKGLVERIGWNGTARWRLVE